MRIAKFDGLEPRRCKDVRGIVALKIGPQKGSGLLRNRPLALKSSTTQLEYWWCIDIVFQYNTWMHLKKLLKTAI